MNWLFKKIILLLLVVGISITSFANCFGKFALTRIVYNGVDGIGDRAWVGKIIRTLLMYVVYVIPIVGIVVGLIDIIIFNVIEFWTDSNPLGLNEFDKEGKYVKNFSRGSESIKLTYLDFGKKLIINVSNNEKSEQFILFKSEPGKFFKEKENKLEEISVSSVNIGSKMILKMATDGKLESSKVIDAKDYNQLEQKYTGEIY